MIKILNKIKQISKAYTEGIYADTSANRKLGRVGMTYEEYNNKIKNEENTEAGIWASAIKYKEDKKLAKEAAEKVLDLGIPLPKLEHKPIPRQYNFNPICGFDKNSNKIIVNSSLNVTKKGKEYKEKGWNVQDNPILHELGHYLAYKMDPNGYSKVEFDSIKEGDRDIISKELSTYASWNQKEFNAELISGILSGKKFSEDIMKFSNLKLNIKGKTPKEILAPCIEDYHKLEKLSERINKRINSVSKAYTEGIYADTPANRKLGRVGMTYAAYAEKLKDEKEKKADKKHWLIQFDSGEEDIFTENQMSKEKLIEEACKYAKDIAEANDYDEYKFDIQEDTNNWEKEDFDKKEYDWLSIKAKKHNGKYEISVYDWNTNEYIRNDKQKREEKISSKR